MLGNRWQIKPPIGCQIDWEHPLARGLAFFAPLWEGSGPNATDLVTGTQLAMNASPTWIGAGSMTGLLSSTSGSCVQAAAPAALKIGMPLTLAMGLRPVAQPSVNNASVFGLTYTNTHTAPYWSAGFQYDNSFTSIIPIVNSGGAEYATMPVATVTVGADAVLSASIKPGSQIMYNGGLQTGSTSNALSSPITYGTSPLIEIGGESARSNVTNVLAYWGAIWGRFLAPAEHAAVARNIWQIFKPKRVLVAVPYAVFYPEIIAGTPSVVPGNHPGHITITLSGDNTSWSSGSTTFTVSGVPGVSLVSQSVRSTTSATLTITTGSGTGTLTISDGTASTTVAVGAPAIAVSPSIVTADETFTLTFTGTNTVWTQETASTLFSAAGGSGASLSGITVTSNTSATATLTVGTLTGSRIITDNSSGSNGSITINPYPVVTSAYAVKSGKWAFFGAASATPASTGVYPPLSITAVSSNPTVTRNGQSVQLGPATWFNVKQNVPFVAYLLECGSVQSFSCLTPGTSYSGAITAIWNGDGGGTSLVLGTATLHTGVTSYTVTNGGSGFAASSSLAVTVSSPGSTSGPGGNIVAQAVAITNSSGVITSVVPICSGLLGWGSGYASATVTPPSGGTGAAIAANVTTYAVVPVATSSDDFTSPPTITVNGSSTGSGATFSAIMSGVTAGDVLTYSASSGWFTTASGGALAATNAPMTNWTGQLEGPTANLSGFQATPTMLLGANHGAVPASSYTNDFTAKDLLLHGGAWSALAGTTLSATDSNGYPTSWTAGGTVTQFANGASNANGIDTQYVPSLTGYYSVQYDDPAVNTSAAHAFWMVTTETSVCTVTPANPNSFPGSGFVAGAITVSSGKVTAIAVASGGSGYQAAVIALSGGAGSGAVVVPVISGGVITALSIVNGGSSYSGSNLPTVTATPAQLAGTTVTSWWNVQYLSSPPTLVIDVYLYWANAAGSGTNGGTSANPWVFSPGSLPNRSNNLAVDDNVIAALTTPRGRTPASMRFMDSTQGSYGGLTSFVYPSDLVVTPGLASWGLSNATTLSVSAVRFVNTNPAKGNGSGGDGTYAWAPSTQVYGDQAWFVGGSDDFGTYNPLPPADNGAFTYTGAGAQGQAVMEVVFASAHGFKTGQILRITGTTTIPLSNSLSRGAISAEVCIAYVTGADTVIVSMPCVDTGAPAQNTPQTVAASGGIVTPVDWTVTLNSPYSAGMCPYEYAAAMVTQLGKTALHLNLPPAGTDALYQAIAAKIAANIGPRTKVYLELGNEDWNTVDRGWLWHGSMATLAGYLPGATPLLGYYETTGSAIPNSYNGAYPLAAAHAFDVFTAAATAAGMSATNIVRGIGSQFYSVTTQTILGAAANYGAKFGALYVAQYPNYSTADTVPPNAFLPAGAQGSPGNWPVDALNDLYRHFCFYNQTYWSTWQSLAQAIATYAASTGVTPQLVCYEAAITNPVPAGNPIVGPLTHDMVHHPSWHDAQWCFYLSLQQGCPTYPGSAPVLVNYFNLYDGPATAGLLWAQYGLGCGVAQPYGDGNGNRYATPQGGLPADDHSHYMTNQAVGLQAFRDWIDVTSPAPTPRLAVRRWFSGLRRPVRRLGR